MGRSSNKKESVSLEAIGYNDSVTHLQEKICPRNGFTSLLKRVILLIKTQNA